MSQHGTVRQTPARALVAGVVLALVSLTLVMPADADVGSPGAGEPATTGSDDAMTREEAEQADVSQGSIERFAEFHEVDEATAERRLRSEMASRGLDERLKERWPDTYAGVWHGERGTTEVVVAFTGSVDEQEIMRGIEQEYAYPELVRIEDGRDQSMVAIEQAYAAAAQELAELADTGQHPDQAVADTEGHLGVGLDPIRNGLTVSLPPQGRQAAERHARARTESRPEHVAERLERAFQRRYEVRNVVVDELDEDLVPDPAQQAAAPEDELAAASYPGCTRADCRWDMLGGLRLVWNDTWCTSGFTVQSGSQDYVLSAGHCPGSWRRNGPDGHYGQVSQQQTSGFIDAELIPHSSNPWATRPSIIVQDGERDFQDIHGTVGINGYTVNWTVGMTGATSGTRKGLISHTSWSGTVGGRSLQDQVMAGYCRAGGDSGAAIFRNDLALGTHVGGSDCTGVFSKIGRITSAFGVSVKTASTSPPPPPPPGDDCELELLGICLDGVLDLLG
jgi:hypothetical protein